MYSSGCIDKSDGDIKITHIVFSDTDALNLSFITLKGPYSVSAGYDIHGCLGVCEISDMENGIHYKYFDCSTN